MKSKNILKSAASLILTAAIIASFCLVAFADDDITFDYDETTKTLTLYGSGSMADYTEETYTAVKWAQYKNQISKVVVSQGITHLGAYAFCRETMLSEISLPDSLVSIGSNALSGTDNLNEITLTDSVEEIGDNAFGFNYDMTANENFTVHCSVGSEAQQYCLKNYIYFDAAFSSTGSDSANITSANGQSIWSFEPQTDGSIAFSSSGDFDTEGMIYDAENYVYSETFSVMKQSALAYGDDNGDDLNFSISYDVKAGEKYYLSAKFRSPEKSGAFDVSLSFVCESHSYSEEVLSEPTCTSDGAARYVCRICGASYDCVLYRLGHSYSVTDFTDGTATVSCARCGDLQSVEFMDYINSEFSPLDVVSDGVVNAKDYAKLEREY